MTGGEDLDLRIGARIAVTIDGLEVTGTIATLRFAKTATVIGITDDRRHFRTYVADGVERPARDAVSIAHAVMSGRALHIPETTQMRTLAAAVLAHAEATEGRGQ